MLRDALLLTAAAGNPGPAGENAFGHQDSRSMAVRGIDWAAMLELRDRDEPFWSVIAAYRSNKKHGTFVGSVPL